MSQLNVDTIKKADGTGNLSVPAETGTLVIKDGSNDVTLNDITAGGIYLGGTGAANFLDDYEEGTFTPTISSGLESITYTTQSGHYTKAGNFVFFVIRLNLVATRNASQLKIGSLPFTGKSGISGQAGSAYWAYVGSGVQSSTTTNPPQLYINTNTSEITFYSGAGNFIGNSLASGSVDFYITGHYLT